MKRLSLVLLGALVLSLGACDKKEEKAASSSSSAPAPVAKEVKKVEVGSVECSEATFVTYIGESKAALEKASEVGHEWNITAKLIELAEYYAGEKQWDEACKEARLSLIQGVMAYQQWEDQKNAGPRF